MTEGSSTAAGPPAEGKAFVEVTFPADARFVVLARVTLAALAADREYDIEAIEDLRIAVDELCVALLSSDASDPGYRVVLRTVLDGEALEVTGRLVDLSGEPAPDQRTVELHELTRSILEVIVDGYELGVGTFRFWKRPTS